jgi:hypothetical protein
VKPASRTAASFAVLFFSFAVALILWTWARHQPIHGGTPAPFRSALEFNGRLWSHLFSPDRLNKHPLPPGGKKPRFNGALGLMTPLEKNWKMEVVRDYDSNVREKFSVTIADLKKLPRTEISVEFYCIEGWPDSNSYAGVKLSDFLDHYGIKKKKYVGFETPDKQYYVSIDIESALHPQTLLVYEIDGRPLAIENGAPLRLVVPVKYGIKSLKRIGHLFLSDRRPPDYWAERGYDWYAGL